MPDALPDNGIAANATPGGIPALRTLQIGNTDAIGNRFNGQDLHVALRRRGIESSHGVWFKEWGDPDTWELARFKGFRHASQFLFEARGVLREHGG